MVSLEDITFTRFTHTGLLGMMVLAILLAVAGAACLLFGDWDDAALAVGLCLPGGAVLFLLIYFVTRSSVFLVAFPGGASPSTSTITPPPISVISSAGSIC